MSFYSVLWGVLQCASTSFGSLAFYSMSVCQITCAKFYSPKQVGSCCGGMHPDPGISSLPLVALKPASRRNMERALPVGPSLFIFLLRARAAKQKESGVEEAACRHVLTISNPADLCYMWCSIYMTWNRMKDAA